MITWQVQEAKAKLTELMKEAKSEPQIISRRGVPEIVVMSLAHYKELTSSTIKEDIVSFFRNSPLYGLEIDLKRDKQKMRQVNI